MLSSTASSQPQKDQHGDDTEPHWANSGVAAPTLRFNTTDALRITLRRYIVVPRLNDRSQTEASNLSPSYPLHLLTFTAERAALECRLAHTDQHPVPIVEVLSDPLGLVVHLVEAKGPRVRAPPTLKIGGRAAGCCPFPAVQERTVQLLNAKALDKLSFDFGAAGVREGGS